MSGTALLWCEDPCLTCADHLWGKWKCLRPGSSPDPELLGDVIGLLLGFCSHTCGRWAVVGWVTVWGALPRALGKGREGGGLWTCGLLDADVVLVLDLLP